MVYFLKYNAPTTVFGCFAYLSKDNEKLTFPLTTVAKLNGNYMGVLHCEQIYQSTVFCTLNWRYTAQKRMRVNTRYDIIKVLELFFA